MEQRRRRPHPTRADQAATRPSNGARPTAIYNGTASPRADQATTRPSNGGRSTAIYNGPASTKQPPDPLTESDLLRFTMVQRRRRPHPTRADQSRPEPTRADQATTRPSNGARSTAIYNATASPAPTRPEPTKQPPDPLMEPDLLRFTMEQRRRRPHPTKADQSRPSNHQTL